MGELSSCLPNVPWVRIPVYPKPNQELAVWYNDNVIYPDKVRLNLYYLKHYSFIKDIEMIFATVLGRHIEYNNEII